MTDRIVIVGSGLAGVSAAIRCAEAGLPVALYSPMPPTHSQSVMAMGGIAAALNHAGDGDDAEQHFKDTMAGGLYLADPNAVRGLTLGAPDVISCLEGYGALFSRTPEGIIEQRNFGGHSKRRTAFCGAQTGRQLMSALVMRLRALEAENRVVQLFGYRFIRAAVDEDGRCVGCVLMDEFLLTTLAIECRALIIATGGMNGVYDGAVGSAANDGIATASLLTQGVEMANLEFVQFHPTTVETPSKRMLISEAARGDGGRLYTPRDGEPWYFMEEYHPGKGNLAPRDVVSREIYKLCKAGLGVDGGKRVFLDIRRLGAEAIRTRLDEVDFICRTYLRIDPSKEPIPVYPGVHFFMGGIKVGIDHQSSMAGLYAAGECACLYHGANRLGANSLLAAVYGGQTAAARIAGGTAAAHGDTGEIIDRAEREAAAEIKSIFREGGVHSGEIIKTIHRTMDFCMSIERDGGDLAKGLDTLSAMSEKTDALGIDALNMFEAWRAKKTLCLAESMIESALYRKESRGAHMRSDFPETSGDFRKTTVTRRQCSPRVSFEPIQEERI